MERTSLITELYLTESKNFPNISLDQFGFPPQAELDQKFTKIPFILEKASISETVEQTDQGEINSVQIAAATHREDLSYKMFPSLKVLAFLRTATGEEHFFGTDETPLRMVYARDTGTTNDSERNTSLNFSQKVPVYLFYGPIG